MLFSFMMGRAKLLNFPPTHKSLGSYQSQNGGPVGIANHNMAACIKFTAFQRWSASLRRGNFSSAVFPKQLPTVPSPLWRKHAVTSKSSLKRQIGALIQGKCQQHMPFMPTVMVFVSNCLKEKVDTWMRKCCWEEGLRFIKY